MIESKTETIHLEWCPGNGTRYEILLTRLGEESFHQPAGYYMAAVTGGKPFKSTPDVMFLAPGTDVLHWVYVAEKLDYNEHDASVVCEMLAAAIGRDAVPTDAYWYREGVQHPFVLPGNLRLV